MSRRHFFWKDASQVECTFQLMSRRFWQGAEGVNVSGLNLSLIKPPQFEVSKPFSPLRTSFASSRACYHDIGSLWQRIKISLTKHFSFEGVFR